MRPDRIIVGEVRGPEALDLTQALSTGHDGGLSTVHAGTPEEAIMVRLPTMIATAGVVSLEQAEIQTNLATELIVQLSRPLGKKRTMGIFELTIPDVSNATKAVINPLWTWDMQTDDWRHDGVPGNRVAKKLRMTR
jgi:pilus assembly protein CpaF